MSEVLELVQSLKLVSQGVNFTTIPVGGVPILEMADGQSASSCAVQAINFLRCGCKAVQVTSMGDHTVYFRRVLSRAQLNDEEFICTPSVEEEAEPDLTTITRKVKSATKLIEPYNKEAFLIRIDELELPAYAFKVLQEANIYLIGDLAGEKSQKLLGGKRLKKPLRVIREMLYSFGLDVGFMLTSEQQAQLKKLRWSRRIGEEIEALEEMQQDK